MTILNKIKIKYQDGKNIIIAFVKENAENLNNLSEVLAKNAMLFQYLFGNLFPKCFSRIDDYGIMAKTSFNKFYHSYHSYHVQKNMLKLIKEEQEEENGEQNKEIDSPINMTTLFDIENDENKENIDPKLQFEQGKQQQQQQQQQQHQEQKQKQNNKRKIENDEQKKQKTQAKKQKREVRKKILLEKLNENTDKMLQIRGKK